MRMLRMRRGSENDVMVKLCRCWGVQWMPLRRSLLYILYSLVQIYVYSNIETSDKSKKFYTIESWFMFVYIEINSMVQNTSPVGFDFHHDLSTQKSPTWWNLLINRVWNPYPVLIWDYFISHAPTFVREWLRTSRCSERVKRRMVRFRMIWKSLGNREVFFFWKGNPT